MGDYYAIARCGNDLRHWGNQNPNAKEKKGHKYIARDWINNGWRYFYSREEYEAFVRNQRKELTDRFNTKRRDFTDRVSARLYNATEDFKDWSGINAASEVKRAKAELRTSNKYLDKARNASNKARNAYSTAEANNFKYAPQYKARYSEKSKAFYKANARVVAAKRHAHSALTKYGRTPLGAAHNAIQRGISAIANIFRKG